MLQQIQAIFENFFLLGNMPVNAEYGTYSPHLLFLSFVVASLGSYTGLRLAADMRKAPTKRIRNFLHFSGAFAFGLGIWSMHFIGMLAYEMNMLISYDPFLTALSLFVAIAIAYSVLMIIKIENLKAVRMFISAVLLGTAICAMHYIGMTAMKMDADLVYIPSYFILSVFIAIAASGAALWIVFTLGQHQGRWNTFWQIISAIVMGAAICGMHYTGMAASVFIPHANCRFDPYQNFDTLAMCVAISSGLTFAVTIIFGFYQSSNKLETLAQALVHQNTSSQGDIGHRIFIQLSIMIILLVSLFSGSYLYVIQVQKQKANYSEIINSAGLQRVLIEQYKQKILTVISAQSSVNLQAQITDAHRIEEIIEVNFKSFLGGGTITLNTKGNKKTVIKLPLFKNANAAIIGAQQEWITLKQKAESTLQKSIDSRPSDLKLEELSQYANTAIIAQDNAVSAIQDDIISYTNKIILIQKISLTCSFVCALIILAYVYFRISLPVNFLYKELKNHRDNLEMRDAEQTHELRRINAQMQVYTDKLEEARLEAFDAKDKAEKASQAKSEFLANMSHELRTPLNSIIGLSKIMTEDAEDKSEDLDMGTIIHKSATHLLEIVNDILDLSKIEAGGMMLEKIGFDIKPIISTVAEALSPAASAKGISLNYSYDKNLPYISGDPIRIRRILTNLVGNAVKYTSQGSVDIVLEYRTIENSTIQITCFVTDTGIGIPQDKLDIIFEKFAQVDDTITRKYGGTGLGLAITKELVEMMGGTIGVESTEGVGTKFWFSIPFEIAEQIHEDFRNNEHKDIQDSSIKRIPVSDAKILVAEDHDLNKAFIKKLLLRMGFSHFDIVGDGMAAVAAYKNKKYDLILMDCHMPEKNGYQATQEIRELEKTTGDNIFIIALTADAMTGTHEKCMSSGMNDYITKPINSDHFRDILETLFLLPDQSIQSEKKTNLPLMDFSSLNDYAETKEEKRAFCEIFFTSTEAALEQLEVLSLSEKHQEWMEVSHQIKGAAGMMGAVLLQKLCSDAQNMSTAPIQERKKIFMDIKKAYHDTKVFLNDELHDRN